MARILIADDEEALRTLVSRQLRRAGHDIELASDGFEAAKILETEIFDLLITDMKMPRMGGMELTSRAREIAPNTEVIIVTGHGTIENATTAYRNGNVFDYLLKPLEDIRELDAVVSRAVERHHLKADNNRLVTELTGRVQEVTEAYSQLTSVLIDLERAKQELAVLARADSLTGLLNHFAVHEQLNVALANRPSALSVLMIDMDGFKLFNDTYGHPAGDDVLRHIAKSLQDTLGDKAAIGRCGGDEFMAVFPGMTASEVNSEVDRFREYLRLNSYLNPSGVPIPLPVCFGIADVESAGDASVNLVSAADNALYSSKTQGGNKVTIHQAHSDDSLIKQGTALNALDSLVAMIDRKDPHTSRHSDDVTEYALHFIENLGGTEETMDAVRMAGVLHDIGKLGIPENILRKPGELSPDEFEVMKQHVGLSTKIVQGLPHLAEVLDAVSNHHERWDGNGYPQGLAGEEIPFLGRVMAIADSYSTMITDQPYRAAMSKQDALREIENGAGTQFDPQLAAVFIQTFRDQGLSATIDSTLVIEQDLAA